MRKIGRRAGDEEGGGEAEAFTYYSISNSKFRAWSCSLAGLRAMSNATPKHA